MGLYLVAAQASAFEVEVHLINGLSGSNLSGEEITVERQVASGQFAWHGNTQTDGSGRAGFQLEAGNYRMRAAPYGQYLYSGVVAGSASVVLEAGILPVRIIHGVSAAPLPNTEVMLEKRAGDGTYSWAATGLSDSDGRYVFEPAAISPNQAYRLRVASPVDGSPQYSPDIVSPGEVQFEVGASALELVVVDAVSQQQLSGVKVSAWELTPGGEKRWAGERTTDAHGQALFDLQGLGQGRVYVFQTKVYDRYIESGEILAAGLLRMEVGTLPVTLRDGVSGDPLAGAEVILEAEDALGEFRWQANALTDALGRHVFEPRDFGSGRAYRLRAASPIDGTWHYSPSYTATASVDFPVGGRVVQLKLVDGLDGSALAGRKITVWEALANGGRHWLGERMTNGLGESVFDLPGLGDGRKYFFETTSQSGASVRSADFIEPSTFVWRLGTTKVVLRDGDSQLPLAGVELTLLERLPGEQFAWAGSGTTAVDGSLRFDPAGLSQGREYVVKAFNPFGQSRSFFSPWLNNEGQLDFAISRNADFHLDIQPPSVLISSPGDNVEMPHTGFPVAGLSDDNFEVAEVVLVIDDPLLGQSELTATLKSGGKAWEAEIAPGRLSAGVNATLTAIARDRMGNSSSTRISLRPIHDQKGPDIVVLEPQNGHTSTVSGIFVRGSVNDQTGVKSLLGFHPASGKWLDVEISESGQWGFALAKGLLNSGEQQLVLRATDIAGNYTDRFVALSAQAAETSLLHRLGRTSFGVSTQALARAEGMGWSAYLAEQLNPESIDDTGLNTRLSDWTLNSPRSLQYYRLIRAIYSERQLQEMMAWFWDNHFNTDISAHGRFDYEYAEMEAYRTEALGYFRDLLQISATSPAMMLYLDINGSRKEEPNENYPRELMELHTLGVNGGYTVADIEALARVFTGWLVQNDAPAFIGSMHDYSDKVVLGELIPGSGASEVNAALDILARHPATAEFICLKLARFLIADQPDPATVSGCAAVFLSSNGLIADVLCYLLGTSAFEQPGSFQAKVKNPLELGSSLVRGIDAELAPEELLSAIDNLGMPSFHNPVPTGWQEEGSAWVNSSQMLGRISLVNNIVFNPMWQDRTHLNPVDWVRGLGLETGQSIVDYFLHLLLRNDFTEAEQAIAQSVLNGDPNHPFDLDGPDAEQRLRETLGTILSFPAFSLH